MEFTYLKREYVLDVAQILLDKYKEARIKLPLLSPKYENIDFLINKIIKYVDQEDFLIGIEDGNVICFMHGIDIDSYKGTVKGALVLPSMHGVKKGYDKRKIYDILYREIAHLWAEKGCYTHSILLYLNEMDAKDIWVYNGFGMYVIDAVRSLDKIKIPNDETIQIRQAQEKDIRDLVPLINDINQHLSNSPIFLHMKNNVLSIEEKYIEWMKTKGNILWIAKKENKIIGYLKTNITEVNQDEVYDGETMAINGAYTLTEYRGQHVMSHLINASLEWAEANHMKRCTTDFETANIEGRNFWLRNFIPYSYAFIRRIDERNYLKK